MFGSKPAPLTQFAVGKIENTTARNKKRLMSSRHQTEHSPASAFVGDPPQGYVETSRAAHEGLKLGEQKKQATRSRSQF